ncbi:MAG: hypothetical protein Q9201_005952, partial [Fulgogasparrea decipioides]
MSYRRPQQQRHPTSDSTVFSTLKHWFNKGSQMQKESKATYQLSQQRQLNPKRNTAGKGLSSNNEPASLDFNSPRGLRQLPRAVHAGARNDGFEVNSASTYSTPNTTPTGSLTSAQSHNHPDQPRSKQRKAPSGRLQISSPKPTDSLVNLAASYPDVQNPKRAYDATRRPVPTPDKVETPLYKNGRGRTNEYQNDQPVKDVAKGRAAVVEGPTSHRSQKTVVRKMEPLKAQKVDNIRQVARETRFEDFMGKEPTPSVPALPTGTSQAFRLSRPFNEPPEFEQPTIDDEFDDRPDTAALSPTESNAETWLRYDSAQAEPASDKRTSNAPLFPRRNMAVPDHNIQKKWNACQTCRQQTHPSTAASYNGTYFCQSCAAARDKNKNRKPSPLETPTNKGDIPRKPLPNPSPRMPFSPIRTSEESHFSSNGSTTLQGTPSPPQPQPRIRRKDVPAGYEHLVADPTPRSNQPFSFISS